MSAGRREGSCSSRCSSRLAVPCGSGALRVELSPWRAMKMGDVLLQQRRAGGGKGGTSTEVR